MNPRTLYSSYGTVLIILGIVGFFLTHAKSALISGLISGILMILMSLLVTRLTAAILIAKIFNILFLGAFAWRSNIAINAVAAGNVDKLIPAVLISLMALISVTVLAVSLLAKKVP